MGDLIVPHTSPPLVTPPRTFVPLSQQAQCEPLLAVIGRRVTAVEDHTLALKGGGAHAYD